MIQILKRKHFGFGYIYVIQKIGGQYTKINYIKLNNYKNTWKKE